MHSSRSEATTTAGYPVDVADGDGEGEGDPDALLAAASCPINEAIRFSAAAYAVRSPARSAFSASTWAACSCVISAVMVDGVPPVVGGGGVVVVGGCDGPAAPKAVSKAAA